ncbi:MAG: exodeoxyribonuclease VII large subunit [Chloroflexota bacterium]
MQILSVDQVTAYLKDVLDNDPLLGDVWIRGEVSSFHKSAAGHCYFTLTDGQASLSCVLFLNNQFGLQTLPRQGDAILAHGRISIYEVRGTYQLYVDAVAPEGAGLLQAEFERMRQRLEAEGLFRPERKRPIPELPERIGVVTSETGSVWHDIQHVIQRRFPLVELILAPSAVQGQEAPAQLVAGIAALCEHGNCDVIIVARGGGSPEDLACFNDEALARAIFAAPVPIVSAVGHETDISIADLVADLRAPTPSAAAELVVPDQRAICERLEETVRGLKGIVRDKIGVLRDEAEDLERRIDRRDIRLEIAQHRMTLDHEHARAKRVALESVLGKRRKVERLDDHLGLVNPTSILDRGYAMVTASASGERLRRAAEAQHNERMRLHFRDGSIDVRKESG